MNAVISFDKELLTYYFDGGRFICRILTPDIRFMFNHFAFYSDDGVRWYPNYNLELLLINAAVIILYGIGKSSFNSTRDIEQLYYISMLPVLQPNTLFFFVSKIKFLL